MSAGCGIAWTATARSSLERLRPEIRALAKRLALDLSGCIERFDDHVVERADGASVYIHAHPRVEITYVPVMSATGKTLTLTHFAAPLPKRVTAFISYSHDDQSRFNEFKKFLASQITSGRLHCWSDHNIKPGEVWADAIKLAAQNAQLAVLLVSHHFLASRFISEEELPLLLARKKSEAMELYWIHITYSPVKGTPLYQYQALGDPEKPLFDIARKQRYRQLTAINDAIRDYLDAQAAD